MKLNKVQLFYIEQHKDKKTPKEIADDVGVSITAVNNAIKKMVPKEEEKVAEAPKKTNLLFDRYKGTVAMNASQSMEDDDNFGNGLNPKPQQPKKERRRKGGIHKIRPDEPTR